MIDFSDTKIDTTNLSTAEKVALLPPAERNQIMDGFSDTQLKALEYDWNFWGRPKQIAPPDEEDSPDWFGWLILAGRGFGKTRTGAERVKKWVTESWHHPIRIAGIAETKKDARDVLVEGESGILSVFPDGMKPKYEPSKARLTWKNGTRLFLFSGDEPDQLRGPQFHKAWVDELAKFQYPQEAWDMLEFGLRLGDNPQVIITTTPRPIPIILNLMKDPDVRITKGSSYENIGNLAPKYIKRVIKRYEGTRLGRQELMAEVLTDAPGAMWTHELIERTRVKKHPELVSIVVAIDPAVTVSETSDETGICVFGKGVDGHGYILRDLSGVFSPHRWASRSVMAYDKWEADEVVGEANNGGDLVEVNIRTVDVAKAVRFKKVNASRGKHIRAAPVASLWEQGKIHVVGSCPEMEDELVLFTIDGYIGERSPNRAEAMIWGAYRLLVGKKRNHYDAGNFASSRR